jgi:hypothetical protein
MKRRPLSGAQPMPDALIDQKLLEEAKRAIESDHLSRMQKCSVCGAPCTQSSAPNAVTNANEGLCWVCRRLKISAWRDSDPQTIQE